MVHARALIHRAIEGDASPQEEEQLRAHLAACEDCRRTDTELRRNDRLLSVREPLPVVPAMHPPRRRPFGFVLPSFVVAGVVVVALIAGTALAAWRTGSTVGTAGPRPSPVIVSSVGICGQAQEQAARAATLLESLQWKRVSLKDLLDSGQFGNLVGQDPATLNSTMACVVAVTGEFRGLRLGLTPDGPDHSAVFATVAGSGAPIGFTSSSSTQLPGRDPSASRGHLAAHRSRLLRWEAGMSVAIDDVMIRTVQTSTVDRTGCSAVVSDAAPREIPVQSVSSRPALSLSGGAGTTGFRGWIYDIADGKPGQMPIEEFALTGASGTYQPKNMVVGRTYEVAINATWSFIVTSGAETHVFRLRLEP